MDSVRMASLKNTPADVWADALHRAAAAGSDCLRDTWAEVPWEMRDRLSYVLMACRCVALAADTESAPRH